MKYIIILFTLLLFFNCSSDFPKRVNYIRTNKAQEDEVGYCIRCKQFDTVITFDPVLFDEVYQVFNQYHRIGKWKISVRDSVYYVYYKKADSIPCTDSGEYLIRKVYTGQFDEKGKLRQR